MNVFYQHVPIPPAVIYCKYMCCQRHFIPLVMAWASTLHKLQGATYGKVPPGQPHNPGTKLIIDLDAKRSESDNPGLAYVAVSRGSTMGKGNRMESAIYFSNNVTSERLQRMTIKANCNDKNVHCLRRNNWIKHLKKNIHDGSTMTPGTKNQLLSWAINSTFEISEMV